MHRWLWTALCGLALCAPAEQVEWQSLEEARASAAISKKPILALFWAEW